MKWTSHELRSLLMGSGSIGIVVGQLAKGESAVAQDSVYACSFSTSLQKELL